MKIKIAKEHWAIKPESLHKILEMDFGAYENKDVQIGSEEKNVTKGKIAIVDIDSIIFSKDDIFTMMFGFSSQERIKANIMDALKDQEVKGIILNIDSPGGVALGTSELSDFILQAKKEKPIWAYVSGMAASAAYWIGSSVDKIIANKTALIGSIGVVTTIPFQEKADIMGYRNYEIVSSNAENKRPIPTTEEGMKVIRKELDAIEYEFISAVASNRGVSTDYVKSNFGRGGVFIAKEALQNSMIDQIDNFDDVLLAFSEFLENNYVSQSNILTNKEGTLMTDKNKSDAKVEKEPKADDVKTYTQDQVDVMLSQTKKEAHEAGYEEGMKAENARVAALEELAIKGHENLIAEAKADLKTTASDLAVKIVKAEKANGEKFLSNLKASEKENEDVEPDVEKPTGVEDEEKKDEAEWAKDQELQAEFGGDKDAFLAYRKHERKNK